MSNIGVLLLTASVLSVLLGVTRGSLGRLGFRGAVFWHLPQDRARDRAPQYLRPERPVGAPDVFPAHAHFMYLDRRPQRERLLPAYLVPSVTREISVASITAWVAGGAMLMAFSAQAWLAGLQVGGAMAGLAGVGLLLLFLKARRQNRWLKPRVTPGESKSMASRQRR